MTLEIQQNGNPQFQLGFGTEQKEKNFNSKKIM
jgi:hypothetical protein